jgi:hypothetical protein
MSLKYTNRPQYGSPSAVDQLRSKLPADAQPIATAPRASATPIVVYGADGKGHWALAHRDSWHKLAPYKDFRTGAVSWRMNGEQIPHAIAWSLPRKK